MSIRVVVIDDTIFFRKVISETLKEIPGIEVVGTAGNGKAALMRIETLKPDLVTLDIEMPEMDGTEVLKQLKERQLKIGVIMVSAHTVAGSKATIKALELGAFDFITKPEGDSITETRKAFIDLLTPKIRAFKLSMLSSGTFPSPAASGKSSVSTEAPPPPSPVVVPQVDSEYKGRSTARTTAIAIGISTGGPAALAKVLPGFPGNFSLPVFIVQHMPPLFTTTLAASLDRKSAIRVKEAENGEIVKGGIAYIAPGGKQMKVLPHKEDGTKMIRITNDPPENNCQPSVDYLFRSLSYNYPGKVVASVMTGMGNDGVMGARLLKRTGAVILAQDESTCVVFGMPMEVIKAGAANMIVPLDEMAGKIIETIIR